MLPVEAAQYEAHHQEPPPKVLRTQEEGKFRCGQHSYYGVT